MRWIYTACFPYDSWSSNSATNMYLPSLSSFVFFIVFWAQRYVLFFIVQNICPVFSINMQICLLFGREEVIVKIVFFHFLFILLYMMYIELYLAKVDRNT